MVKLSEVFSLLDRSSHELEFMKTGFKKFDDMLDGGFLRKELIVLGGFTGVGKSYVSGHLFHQIASQGFKSAYFSLEISNEMVVSRLIGSIANLKPTRVMMDMLTPDEAENAVKAKAVISVSEDFMTFYDTMYTLSEIKKQVLEHKYEFVVIDFIQNVVAPGESDHARLTLISLELQRLAKEANCTILTLSQLSNSVGREGSQSKQLEYKGSGSIATVCDIGLFIERAEYFEGANWQGLTMTIKKNRRGMSGNTYNLSFKIPGGMLREE